MGINPAIIEYREEFDLCIRGAMAELSDGNTAPDHITYENVMQLIEQIRTSVD